MMGVLSSFSFAETPEASGFIEPVSLELNTGAAKGTAFTSLNAGFTSPAGSLNLVMCGLTEEQQR